MKSNVAVTEYVWAPDSEDITTLDFAVFKKGFFGSIKKDRSFEGWCLCFKHKDDKTVDIDSISMQNSNFHTQPLNLELAYAVLLAGSNTLKNAGEDNKAKLLNQAAISLFKQKILKE